MKSVRLILFMSLAFASGSWIGYTTFPSRRAGEPDGGRTQGKQVRNPENFSSGPVPSRSARREQRPTVRVDEKGDYLLPPKLAERFHYMVLNGMKVNREDMKVIGLDEGQMDRLQQLVDDAFKRSVERIMPAMREFTNHEDEIVWKVEGDRDAVAADRAWMEEQVHDIIGKDSPMLEREIIGKLTYLTLVNGVQDYFIRISRSDRGQGSFAFENLLLTPRDNGPQPEPGDSFYNLEGRYSYSSTHRFGGTLPPPNLAPLLEGKDWRKLLDKRVPSAGGQ